MSQVVDKNEFDFIQGLHVPVVHIPAFRGMNDMPFGVSLVAGRGRDGHLLRVSRVLGEVLMAEAGWQAKALDLSPTC